MASKSQLKRWKKDISMMSKVELEYAILSPDRYLPEYLEMVKTRFEDLSSVSFQDEILGITLKALNELGCSCEVDKEGTISFYFQGSQFDIFTSGKGNFLDIWEYNWEIVDLKDTVKVERLKKAINSANGAGNITTVYEIDKEDQKFLVHSTTSILYRPMIFNLKDYLYIRLHNFFFAHELVNADMVLQMERDWFEQPEPDRLYNDGLAS